MSNTFLISASVAKRILINTWVTIRYFIDCVKPELYSSQKFKDELGEPDVTALQLGMGPEPISSPLCLGFHLAEDQSWIIQSGKMKKKDGI